MYDKLFIVVVAVLVVLILLATILFIFDRVFMASLKTKQDKIQGECGGKNECASSSAQNSNCSACPLMLKLIEQMGVKSAAPQYADVESMPEVASAVEAVKPEEIKEEELAVEQEQEVAETEETQVEESENEDVVVLAVDKKTMAEKYEELPEEIKELYNGLIDYALSKDEEAVKAETNAYTTVRIKKEKLIKLSIKRDTLVGEFLLVDPNLKHFVKESNVKSVKPTATKVKILSTDEFETCKNMIDMCYNAYQDELEYRKEKRREKRRLKNAEND